MPAPSTAQCDAGEKIAPPRIRMVFDVVLCSRFSPWLIALLLAIPGAAKANYKDWTLSLAPSFATANLNARMLTGGGATLDVGFGVNDALAVHATSTLAWYALPASAQAPGGSVSSFSALLGIVYTFDIMRLLPSASLGIGIIGVRGDAQFGHSTSTPVLAPLTGLVVSLGGALDYLITSHLGVGFEVRYQIVATDYGRMPMSIELGPRLRLSFGK